MNDERECFAEDKVASSSPQDLANNDYKWNRDVGRAYQMLESLESHQICQQCHDKLDALWSRQMSEFQVGPSHDEPICGLCKAFKVTEQREVSFARQEFGTGEIDPKPMLLNLVYDNNSEDGPNIILNTYNDLGPSYPWFDPWPADPSTADLHHMKHVLSYCKQHHTSSCDTIKAPITRLRVLNCTRRAVEPASAEVEYVALSYVWGSPSASTSAGQGKYALTIEDAITATLQLGYTYLWVDQLCIDQNGEHKAEQIRQMDLIYHNAELTIVAAAGQNSSDGLPGVTKSRNPRMHFRDGNLLYYEVKPELENVVDASKWATRGWTFQEWIFARRKLVFTDTEAFFVCGAIDASGERGAESAPLSALWDPDLKPPHGDCFSLWDGFPSGVAKMPPREIGALVAKFAVRSLTYSSDALNAVEGVFRAFERLDPPMYSIWGIPVLVADAPTRFDPSIYDMLDTSLEDVLDSDTPPAAPIASSEGFVIGMCWYDRIHMDTGPVRRKWYSTVVREPQFPSWTWAGWRSSDTRDLHWDEAMMQGASRGSLGYRSTVADIAVELQDGRVLSWTELEELSFLRDAPQLLTHFLRLEVPTIDVALRWDPVSQCPRAVVPYTDPTTASEFVIEYSVDGSIAQEAEAGVTGPQNRQFKGLVLSNESGDPFDLNSAFIIVVEEKGPWVERVGSLAMWPRYIQYDKEKLGKEREAFKYVNIEMKLVRLG